MRSMSTLMLALLLALPALAATTGKPSAKVEQPGSAPAIWTSVGVPELVDGVLSTQHREAMLSAPDDICYKIRAYLFKRDDDHVPEFLGSTTCGPRPPRLKHADKPAASVAPAIQK